MHTTSRLSNLWSDAARRTGRAAALALCACTLASTASAHEFWISPSTFRLVAGQRLDVSLMVGDGMPGEPVARNPERIVSFEAVSPASPREVVNAPISLPIKGRPGAHPAGQITLATPGTSVLVYRSTNAFAKLEAEAFESYLREDGMESIIALRRERGQTDQPGLENYSRCCKALVTVTDAEAQGEDAAKQTPALPMDRVVGLRNELVLLAIEDPDPKTPEVTIRVRNLFEGSPNAGAQVCVRSPLHPGKRLIARTNAAGEASIEVPWTGMLLFSSVHMVQAPAASPAGAASPSGPQAQWESTWTSLAFERPAHAAAAAESATTRMSTNP
jgi:hypothetical protein